MAPPTLSPPSELLREKPRGSREQPQPSVRLCKEMWAIEREGRERGFRRTPALSTGRAMLRDGFNEWCV